MAYSAASAQTSTARIDWELLPSLWGKARSRADRGGSVWSDTVTSEFEPQYVSDPFEEVLPGLAVREVREPEVFTIFFG